MEEFLLSLVDNSFLVYLVLFFGSLGDTLIGLNLFVYGEPFFLAGAYLASLDKVNIYFVYFILVLGAFVGDTVSFLIGKKYSFYFFEKKKIISKEKYNLGKNFFNKHGAKAILLSKFLGPVSWITPFMAGSLKYSYKKFLPYNMLGTFLGIGQFILIGYFGFKYINISLFEFALILVCVIFAIFFSIYYKKRKSKFNKIQ